MVFKKSNNSKLEYQIWFYMNEWHVSSSKKQIRLFASATKTEALKILKYYANEGVSIEPIETPYVVKNHLGYVCGLDKKGFTQSPYPYGAKKFATEQLAFVFQQELLERVPNGGYFIEKFF